MKLHKDITNKKAINNFRTIEERCMSIHDNFYDYSKFIYLNSNTKSIIICPIHGEWLQTISSHLSGSGCYYCGTIKQHLSIKSKIEDVIIKANTIHNNEYDYSKFKYINTLTKSTIVCKVHGEWEATMGNHLCGHKCPECANIKRKNTKKNDIEKVIIEAHKVHNNKYDYSKYVYVNNRTKSIVICPVHGEFKQRMGEHRSGQGCPKCAVIKSDNDCLYVWQVENENIYKIGVTSHKLGMARIDRVAKSHSVKPIIVAFIKVDNAFRVESELHSVFKSPQNLITKGDGYTEFKTLTRAEVIELLDYLNQEMISGILNYPIYKRAYIG